MKLTDKLISKYGADKLLHFTVSSLIVSYFSLINIYCAIISFIIILIMSYIKEKYLDNNFDKKDIIAAIFGGLLSIIIKLIIIIIWLKKENC